MALVARELSHGHTDGGHRIDLWSAPDERGWHCWAWRVVRASDNEKLAVATRSVQNTPSAQLGGAREPWKERMTQGRPVS